MPRDEKAPKLTTWADVLAYALTLIDQADPSHFLTNVSVGEYAASVGGGYWVDLKFSYNIGTNTSTIQTKERRIGLVVDEWDRRRTEAQAKAAAGA